MLKYCRCLLCQRFQPEPLMHSKFIIPITPLAGPCALASTEVTPRLPSRPHVYSCSPETRTHALEVGSDVQLCLSKARSLFCVISLAKSRDASTTRALAPSLRAPLGHHLRVLRGPRAPPSPLSGSAPTHRQGLGRACRSGGSICLCSFCSPRGGPWQDFGCPPASLPQARNTR